MHFRKCKKGEGEHNQQIDHKPRLVQSGFIIHYMHMYVYSEITIDKYYAVQRQHVKIDLFVFLI